MKENNLLLLAFVIGSFGYIGSDLYEEYQKKELLNDLLELPEQPTCSSEIYGENGFFITITWPAEFEEENIKCDPQTPKPLIEKYLRILDLKLGTYEFQSTKEAKLYFDMGDI